MHIYVEEILICITPLAIDQSVFAVIEHLQDYTDHTKIFKVFFLISRQNLKSNSHSIMRMKKQPNPSQKLSKYSTEKSTYTREIKEILHQYPMKF